MKNPVNIITEQEESSYNFGEGSWGSYNQTTKQWDSQIKAATGRQVREWIQKEFKSLNERVDQNPTSLYGPYENIISVLSSIPETARFQGLTVGIINDNGEIEEYWWKTTDYSSEGLVKKIEDVTLTISASGDTIIDADEGSPIVFNFTIDGRAIISKGYVYQVVGTTEVFLSEFTNIGKGSNSVSITAPQQSGIYTYRVKITDTGGYFAKTASGSEYIEYTIRYGSISIDYNLSNLNRIQIKNIYTLTGQYFTCNISVRDDSYNVTGVYLSDGADTNIELSPYKTLTEVDTTYLGFNYYVLPSNDELTQLDGKFCYIKIVYTEDGEEQIIYKELFTILKADSLEFVPQSATKDYYVNFADYYTFQLRSGVANTSVYITALDDSDFSFEPVTVTSYNNFSLRVLPKEVKQDAHLKIRCRFIISNQEQIREFDTILGNIKEMPERKYYEPEAGTSSVQLDKFVDAGEGDFVDDMQYYKVVDNLTSKEYDTCAFIVDMYCRVNQTNNKKTEYILIFKGNTKIGYITEDKIACSGITTDTPLNEWVQISIGYNLKENIIRSGNPSGTDVTYKAIYINGMVVKNTILNDNELLSYSANEPITVKILGGLNVQKCFVYSVPGRISTINPNADLYSIAYTNYLAYNPTFEEPSDLPLLKLMRITDQEERLKYFNLLKQENDDLKHLTVFGTIGLTKAKDLDDYTGSIDDNTVDNDRATLFRQAVNIKKPAQKEYAVLCKGQWIVDGINVLEGCIIEVHTQGTSTLQYSVPNFKFTFWKLVESDEETKLEKFYPEFIEKSDGEYYKENIYTAKADYMDSSHLNNTPTCNFYNNLIQQLIADENFPGFKGSPSAKAGNLDAIKGFPIVLEISDSAQNLNDSFINIGSFMLNIDKTGDSLGFEVDGQSCISLEGTSNDEQYGTAGRFILPTDEEFKDYTNSDGSLNTEEIEKDAKEITDLIAATKKKLDLELFITHVENSRSTEIRVKNHPYVRWCNFLSNGFEYRYPDSDIYKTSKSGDFTYLTKVVSADNFAKIYRFWIWVNRSDTNPNYRDEFENYFDLHYCMLYFIQLMVYGQTDNLGKNAMFDSWDGIHWFPRPYDLDSEAGLDNNGNDNIPPFAEIMPAFSLDYNSNYNADQLAENHLLQDSTINYGGEDLRRYPFSSYDSKLWINFYKNFSDRIRQFYSQLRSEANYTPEAIINACEEELINKLGVLQYNQDFRNKYLANSDQPLAYGNRWYKFKKWITQRFAFCDSYFGASDAATYDIVSAITYDVEVESPQYITQTYLENNTIRFVTDKTTFSAGGGAATKIMLVVNQPQVLNTNLFKYVSYGNGSQNYNKLISLDVSGNKYISNIESLVGNDLSNLKELNISNSGVANLVNLPQQLKKLTAENVQLSTLSFQLNSLIEEISLKNSTITGDLNLSLLPNLKTLDISNCTFVGNITLSQLPSLETFITTDTKFSGAIIIQNNVNIHEFDFSSLNVNSMVFDGNNINITKLNFKDTIFGQDSINLNAISANVEEIYFNNCLNLKHLEMSSDIQFQKIKLFSINDSSIESIGEVKGEFDASRFISIASLKRATYTKEGALSSTSNSFTFQNTKVTKIVNLDWSGTGASLFENCTELVSIEGKLAFTNSLNYLFSRCNKLESIPTPTISSNVTTAQYIFAGANLLGYTLIEKILALCTNVTDFYGACWGTKFDDNTTLRLDTIFKNNKVVTNLSRMFGDGGFSTSWSSVKNTLKISGYIPNTVTTTYMMFYGVKSLTVPYEMFLKASSLENMSGCFCNITTFEFYPVVDETGASTMLPNFWDEDGGVIAVKNAIAYTFFYGANSSNTVLKNILGLFLNTNVQPVDNRIFEKLVALENCSACFFSGSPRSFTQPLVVNTLWANNPNLKNVSGCFRNILNATCTGQLTFHSNVTSIDMSGLFGIEASKGSSSEISINIGRISPDITTGTRYSIVGNTTNYQGVFQNRKVRLLDSDTTILSKLSGICRQLFYNADIYLNDSVTTFNLSNVSECYYMFYNCKLYRYNETGAYSDSDRKFVAITMPTSCRIYTGMFYNSSVLSDLPELNSAIVEDVQEMYRSCIINKTSVVLSPNYFSKCRSSLSTTNKMFYGNKYLTELSYDSTNGLLENCTNLSNVQEMFSGANFLHKGIPNNFFGTTALPNITSLKGMFASTSILHDVEDESVSTEKKCIDSNTMAPLTRLQSVEEMFYHTCPANAGNNSGYGVQKDQITAVDGSLQYVINPNTFSNIPLLSIRKLFYQSNAIKNVPFKFYSFEYGEDAFSNCPLTLIDSDFVQELYLPNIRNMSRMFYMNGTNTTTKKTVANLGTFINKLNQAESTANMANIAGNLANTDVADLLKEPITKEEIFTGFDLSSKVTY